MAPFYGVECELTLGKSLVGIKAERRLKRGDRITFRGGLIGEGVGIVVNENDAVIENSPPRFKPTECDLTPLSSKGEVRQIVNKIRLFGRINLVHKKSVMVEGSKFLLEWRKK